jgi:hypothetical protein
MHRQVNSNTSIIISAAEGDQTLKLSQVSENCTLAGSNPVTIKVKSKQTTRVEFTLSCVAMGMMVTTHTSGVEAPDSYQLMVRGSPRGRIGANTSVTLSRMPSGVYQVTLGEKGSNCSIAGDSLKYVTVVIGSVAPVTFDVTCQQAVRTERIAFIDQSPSAANQNILIVDPDGSHMEFVASGQFPSWSRDGTRIVYTAFECGSYYYFYDYECNYQLQTFDPELRRLSKIDTSLSLLHPAWSPVEDVIAASEQSTGYLYLIALNGALTRLQIQGNPRTDAPAWSPDGQRLAFACDFQVRRDICIANKDGTDVVRLGSDGVFQSDPAWSSDGNAIVFATRVASEASQIAVMNADGTNVRMLAEGSDPSWSRDGTRIVFSRVDGLFTMLKDGSAQSRLTTGRHNAPAWRP